MRCYYDLKPLADQIHEEKLHEAQERQLAGHARADLETCYGQILGPLDVRGRGGKAAQE
jgi:hypothetical protein